jgi:hypothetical protein
MTAKTEGYNMKESEGGKRREKKEERKDRKEE